MPNNHTLDALITRLSLFGSPASITILLSLKDQFCDDLVIEGEPAAYSTHASKVRTAFMSSIWRTLSEFAQTVRAEAPIKIIDGFTHHSGNRIKMVMKQDHANKSKQGKRHY